MLSISDVPDVLEASACVTIFNVHKHNDRSIVLVNTMLECYKQGESHKRAPNAGALRPTLT